MNRRLASLGLVLITLYGALFVMLNYVQVVAAPRLEDNPDNTRAIERSFDEARGTIVTADGAVVARSVPSAESRFERKREYPEAELFAHTAGWLSLEFGAEGVERTYNDELAGRTISQRFGGVSDLFVDRDNTGNLTMTIRRDVQVAARDALGQRKGSVVAIDPRTGDVLALWSWPSFDPNDLSGHDLDLVRVTRAALLAEDDNPMLPRAYRERFFPGSTFKVITGGVGVEQLVVTRTEPVYKATAAYVPPASSRPITNFGGATCGGPLFEIMRVSCNTAFAEMGAETIGPDLMVEGSEDFGFNRSIPFDLPVPARSRFPTDFGELVSGPGGPESVYENSAALAQAAIGQNDVAATPLLMAMIAGAVANDGVMMEPHVMADIRDVDGRVVDEFDPRSWRQPLSPFAAETIRQAMLDVASAGTAQGLLLEGYEIGGKTGTAQVGEDPVTTHAWVIAFGGDPGERARVAVAVIVEADPALGQQTGGAVAAPIARQVLAAALSPPQPVSGGATGG